MERSCAGLIAPGLIDSALKLQVILLFYRHPRWSGDAAQLSEWLHEIPWALADALEALAEAGLLGRIGAQGATGYRLEPRPEHLDVLKQLVSTFEDPLTRDNVYYLVRDAEQERQMRAWPPPDPSTSLGSPLTW